MESIFEADSGHHPGFEGIDALRDIKQASHTFDNEE